MNSELYERIILHGDKRGCKEYVPASSLRVGDILILKRSQRVPADLLLLHANDPTGSVFVATDQLDGETNWKVRYDHTSEKSIQKVLISFQNGVL